MASAAQQRASASMGPAALARLLALLVRLGLLGGALG
jgi:hypothetical protein